MLGIAAILYAWMQPKLKQQQTASAGSPSDVEETLEHFMAEMERDNEEIIGLIADMKQETVSKQLSLQEQLTELRQRLQQYERQNLLLESRLEKLEKEERLEKLEPLEEQGQQTQARSGDRPSGSPENSAQEGILLPQEQAEELQPQPPKVRERYPELFALYDQGKSIDTVAKATGMARGEVQLILQLAKREETAI
ncbi:hypothetical protein [Paenibacillus pinistramenti]|uniref:hypothetical protein n=1 Tax=Paenibacillus pinistramenti TaxID=1768003 RepID=UPI001108C0ED|nr:hypothetical protein [Paenibacillus pinistramenti]